MYPTERTITITQFEAVIDLDEMDSEQASEAAKEFIDEALLSYCVKIQDFQFNMGSHGRTAVKVGFET